MGLQVDLEADAAAANHQHEVTSLSGQRDQTQAESTTVRAELVTTQARVETAHRHASATAEAARELSEDLRARLERADERVSEARDTAATAPAERDAAASRSRPPEPEREHAEQRLADQRTGYEERLRELRDQLAARSPAADGAGSDTEDSTEVGDGEDGEPHRDDAGSETSGQRLGRASRRRGSRPHQPGVATREPLPRAAVTSVTGGGCGWGRPRTGSGSPRRIGRGG